MKMRQNKRLTPKVCFAVSQKPFSATVTNLFLVVIEALLASDNQRPALI